MKSQLRPSKIDEVLEKNIQHAKRRELVINPEGGLLDVRNFAAALRRASPGDLVLVPAGEYPAFELRKGIEIRSLQPGATIIKGTMRVQAEGAAFNGLEFRSETDEPAVVLEKGLLVLEDCVVRGSIQAGTPGNKAQLYLKTTLVENAVEGIVLDHQALGEINSTRVTDCRIGLALRGGAHCALYHTRFESCLSTEEADPGAAIFAEKARLYCEGLTFSANGVGAYLRQCEEARFFTSHFQASETAALIALGGDTTPPLLLHSCTIDGQTSARCAQISLTGGAATLAHCTIKAAPAPALSAEQTRLELIEDRFFASDDAAIDARACHLSGEKIHAESAAAAGLAATACQGSLRAGTFSGRPSTQTADSPQLRLESCRMVEPEAEQAAARPVEPGQPLTMDNVLQRLRKTVNQEIVRNELERLLRLAHADRQRSLEGLPVTEQSFHSVFVGTAGTGKLAAARMLAEGLHIFGVISAPHVVQMTLEEVAGASNGTELPGGVIFIRARMENGSAIELSAAQQGIERLAARTDEVIILVGERDEVRRIFRNRPSLDRIFRNRLHFSSYGPVELATLFTEFCARDHIPLNPEAAKSLLIAFHLYCDRKDRRFANTQGVETLYEATRRRYLERCSVSNRFDLGLEPRDLDLPQDKVLRAALDRNPAFISFCPACTRENPWLIGVSSQYVCLHCGAPYTANWGIWKDSATYRRIREALATRSSIEVNPALRKASLPVR